MLLSAEQGTGNRPGSRSITARDSQKASSQRKKAYCATPDFAGPRARGDKSSPARNTVVPKWPPVYMPRSTARASAPAGKRMMAAGTACGGGGGGGPYHCQPAEAGRVTPQSARRPDDAVREDIDRRTRVAAHLKGLCPMSKLRRYIRPRKTRGLREEMFRKPFTTHQAVRTDAHNSFRNTKQRRHNFLRTLGTPATWYVAPDAPIDSW